MVNANLIVVLKNSGITGNVPTSLANGELALNYADGKLYYRNATNTILSISGSGGGSSNSFATINSNSSLVFATSNNDILSIRPGNNITITTNTSTKTITINSTGGGSQGVGGYYHSTLNYFPEYDYSENESGDENEAYVGETGPTVDPFGVSLVTNFDCMDPVGSTQISDLGTVS
jgi:hypothetical protein